MTEPYRQRKSFSASAKQTTSQTVNDSDLRRHVRETRALQHVGAQRVDDGRERQRLDERLHQVGKLAATKRRRRTRSTSASSRRSSGRKRLQWSCAREAINSPSALNESEARRHKANKIQQRAAHGDTEKHRAEPHERSDLDHQQQAAATAETTAGSTCRGMGVAIRRFMSFLRRASTMANPMPQIALPIRFIPSRPGIRKSM